MTHLGDATFVFVQETERAGQGDRVHRVERPVDEAWLAGFSFEREMEAVIIGGTESRDHGATSLESLGQIGITEQGGQVEAAPFRKDRRCRGKIRDEEVTPVGRE